jgi:hypothetical protein
MAIRRHEAFLFYPIFPARPARRRPGFPLPKKRAKGRQPWFTLYEWDAPMTQPAAPAAPFAGILAGKKGLILGVANNRSIAWGIMERSKKNS